MITVLAKYVLFLSFSKLYFQQKSFLDIVNWQKKITRFTAKEQKSTGADFKEKSAERKGLIEKKTEYNEEIGFLKKIKQRNIKNKRKEGNKIKKIWILKRIKVKIFTSARAGARYPLEQRTTGEADSAQDSENDWCKCRMDKREARIFFKSFLSQ